MWSGVSKSGSPAPRPITSSPAARNSLALAEIDKVKQNIELGKNDVLIGTHSLLNNDIYLNNIGLLIVDEEHRFGVKQKEKVKHYKKNIDVLLIKTHEQTTCHPRDISCQKEIVINEPKII